MCQFNSRMAYYKVSTKNTKIKKFNMLPKICFTDLFYLLCTLIIAIITVVIIITKYSKFQFKICFNKAIGILKKSVGNPRTL